MAEGGFSTVYSVKKSSNPKITYALKRMFVNNVQDLRACRTEIELMHSLLTKPGFPSNNVIQYYSHSIHYYDSEVYEIRLLMENATGGTLLDMMNSRLRSGMRGFESDVIRKVLKDIIQAIAALHFHKNGVIVHRDLKIENILMNGRGDFVICDLGSATMRIVDTEKLEAGEIMGYEEELNKVTTQLYKSPEMVDLYQGQVIGSGVDIWALGCMIYHMCFFQLPFDSNLAIQNASFTIPDSTETDQRLDQTILKLANYCLTPEVTNRPNIYQVSTVIWTDSQNPIRNLKESVPPIVSSLKLPLTESQAEKIKLESRKRGMGEFRQLENRNSSNGLSNSSVSISNQLITQTSINPRLRPEDQAPARTTPPPSVEAVISELQKRSTTSSSLLHSSQVYTVLEKLLPTLKTAGDRVKANKKNTDLVSKKYSELAEHAKNDAKILEKFKPQAQQLAACYHDQKAQLSQSIDGYKRIHEKVQILQELYAKLEGVERENEVLVANAFQDELVLPEIFTAEFPDFDENSQPVDKNSEIKKLNVSKSSNNSKSPKGHRRTRSETPITELARLRLEQSKQVLNLADEPTNGENLQNGVKTRFSGDFSDNFQNQTNTDNLFKTDNCGFDIQNGQKNLHIVKERANTLPVPAEFRDDFDLFKQADFNENPEIDTYQHIQRDLFTTQAQEQSPFDCVPGFTDSFTNDNANNNNDQTPDTNVDLFGAAPF